MERGGSRRLGWWMLFLGVGRDGLDCVVVRDGGEVQCGRVLHCLSEPDFLAGYPFMGVGLQCRLRKRPTLLVTCCCWRIQPKPRGA
ncbi:hypothetical protein EDD18DRAFT_1174254 [Armillaria luteobubalina]|uniref:Secreted protein n=1 Tax=Armillaria luteobubalina TaxID=153913 RepID=A0AA39Q415_9AGAR|nr:hypothetical protein EDD18DRAFT_1174254 [Armillaria luteobubalina]